MTHDLETLAGWPATQDEAAHERLSKRLALAVFFLRCLSLRWPTPRKRFCSSSPLAERRWSAIPSRSLFDYRSVVSCPMSYRQIILNPDRCMPSSGKSNLGRMVAAGACSIVFDGRSHRRGWHRGAHVCLPRRFAHRGPLRPPSPLVTVVNLPVSRTDHSLPSQLIFYRHTAAMLGVGAIQICWVLSRDQDELPLHHRGGGTIDVVSPPARIFLRLYGLTGVEVIFNGFLPLRNLNRRMPR